MPRKKDKEPEYEIGTPEARRRVAEAVRMSGGAREFPLPRTTISSKYQITLPARLVRELGLQPGDQVAVEVEHGSLVLHPRPKNWVKYLAGSIPGFFGTTKEEVEANLLEIRGDWGTYDDERDQK